MAKIKVLCAIVDETRCSFGVEIDDDKQVWELKEAIKAEMLHTHPINQLQMDLLLSKTESGAWLQDGGGLKKILQTPQVTAKMTMLVPTWKLKDPEVFGLNASLEERVVHILVKNGESRKVETVDASHPRKRRWDELNEVLGKNKKLKTDGFTGFSYASFPEVNAVLLATLCEPTSKPITDENLAALGVYLDSLAKVFGFLVEETIVGKRVQVDGTFEFLLKRGEKRVCIVLAKHQDFEQGIAQAYMGSEALADSEGLSKVYSIVTDFQKWIFSRSLDNKIECSAAMMMQWEYKEGYAVLSRKSVKHITGIIYSILSDDM